MEEFICVKFPVEDPRDGLTGSVLREFGVVGLPTFVILEPNETQRDKATTKTQLLPSRLSRQSCGSG